MAYTYMWFKDGREVSGQTSSTYSFSPLLAVHSGQYSCRVSVGSMTVTSEDLDITVVGESGMSIHEYHSHCPCAKNVHIQHSDHDFLEWKT